MVKVGVMVLQFTSRSEKLDIVLQTKSNIVRYKEVNLFKFLAILNSWQYNIYTYIYTRGEDLRLSVYKLWVALGLLLVETDSRGP